MIDVLTHIILLLNWKLSILKLHFCTEYQVFSSHIWSTTKTSTSADLWAFQEI